MLVERLVLVSVLVGMILVGMTACSHPGPQPTVVAPAPAPPARAQPAVTRLVVMPTESLAFPRIARAATESLSRAGIAQKAAAQLSKQLSKVSIEVVQLSIECVDASVVCYEQVGRSLSANGLLFARIDSGKRKHPKVTVMLFDVDMATLTARVEKEFVSEAAATAGLDALVAQVTEVAKR
jgi:hypothetical protein